MPSSAMSRHCDDFFTAGRRPTAYPVRVSPPPPVDFVGPTFTETAYDPSAIPGWVRVVGGLSGALLVALGVWLFVGAHEAQPESVSGIVSGVHHHRGHLLGLFPSGYDIELADHAHVYTLEPSQFPTPPPVPTLGDHVFFTVDHSSDLVLAVTMSNDVRYARDAFSHPDRLLWQQRGVAAAVAAFGIAAICLALLGRGGNNPADPRAPATLDERVDELTSESSAPQP
jgi:hypothetical protein